MKHSLRWLVAALVLALALPALALGEMDVSASGITVS